MNSYDLSRKFWDWAYENPEIIKPNHAALYFFIIEHCNRLGWKKKFGLPTTMAKEAIGIRSYNTFINCFNDLAEFGFIDVIERSKNQFSSNIIALSNFNKACDKALDKAFIKHVSKQSESTGESNSSIDKQVNQLTSKPINKQTNIPALQDFLIYSKSLSIYHPSFDFQIQAKYNSWKESGWKDGNNKKILNWKTKLQNTMPYFKKDFTIIDSTVKKVDPKTIVL